MESLFRFFRRKGEDGIKRLKGGISGLPSLASMLLPCLAQLVFSALLASYSPFEGAAPFGASMIIASWYAGSNVFFSCAGAAAGYLLSGDLLYAAVSVFMGAAIFLIGKTGSVQRLFRILIAYASQACALLFFSLLFHLRVLFILGASTVSVFGAVVLGFAINALRALIGGRNPGDTELLTLAASSGLIVLSMRSFNVFGISCGIVFAGVCALFASYRLGISSVAFAVTLGAGRVLASGQDLHFIAVLASAVLFASSFRGLGKWAVLAAFAFVDLLFRAFMGRVGSFDYPEIALSCLIFALVPVRLYCPEGGALDPVSPSTSSRYRMLQYKTASLSEVLGELARVYGPEDGRMLQCVSDSLKRSLSCAKQYPCCFRTEYGAASDAGKGSTRSGDSFTVREIDGRLLLALSDGMGSGRAAAEESRAALGLLCDLITVGFNVEDAAECVNSMLCKRRRDDMYATLDVMLLDLDEGTASMRKYGAPSSFVLRGNKLFTLYAEALPLGVVNGSGGNGRSIRLRSGDTVIMMSDGVSDALGNGLIAAVTDNVLAYGDPEIAANSLLDAAKSSGGTDDMTVVVCRVEGAEAA